jgi:2OG-Fe(II) oxygenase superfamily
MAEPHSDGIFVRRDFLSPFALARVLGAFDRLATSWASSESLGLLGRAGTTQVRATDIAVRARLDEIRGVLAPAALNWARTCGFRLPPAPHLQIFPVRMLGDAEAPPYQEPHVDSDASQDRPPICTNVYYARALAIEGGELAARRGPDMSDPVVVPPQSNTMVTFGGDRVHWVRPLRAGERLSVVINFY